MTVVGKRIYLRIGSGHGGVEEDGLYDDVPL